MADKTIYPSDKEVLVDCRNAQFPIMHNTLWYVDKVTVSGAANSFVFELKGAKELLYCSVIPYKDEGYFYSEDLRWDFSGGLLTVSVPGMFANYNIMALQIFAIARI